MDKRKKLVSVTIVEVRHNRFVVYTESGKVVIQTSDLRVARRFLNAKS